MKKNKVFFTGTLQTPQSPLADFCKKMGWELTVQSLLDFKPVSFEIQRPFGVVFFSSIRSYTYFIQQVPTGLEFECACIGQQTAQRIEALGGTLAYVGEKAGNPDEVALDFKKWAGTKRILFPLAKDSHRSISTHFPKVQIEEIICYETLLLKPKVDRHDWYIFTSPSNVLSYLENNKIPKNSLVISWGSSTYKTLIKKNIEPFISLNNSTEKELVEIMQKEVNDLN